ncbi:hypothetical protein, partial [Pseudomonas sp. R5(2019)]|uniref:hypothetical protein n=1 Tax=Pseudomonas sp. R5(2019) TaxID=2697566 RepID=UPI001C499FDC
RWAAKRPPAMVKTISSAGCVADVNGVWGRFAAHRGQVRSYIRSSNSGQRLHSSDVFLCPDLRQLPVHERPLKGVSRVLK